MRWAWAESNPTFLTHVLCCDATACRFTVLKLIRRIGQVVQFQNCTAIRPSGEPFH